MQDTINTAGPTTAEHPTQIAGYRILGPLGEGGMGRVYRAQENHPPREVALKLMRALTTQAQQRFRREAELLATLEHPGIARLYATGEADFAGMRLPWLAMEYVRGMDLVAFAQARQLDLPARVRLVIAVCRAVHYAHGRGVIHRDLKPGNILVDEAGQPRVLDFGIARLLDDEVGVTEAGQLLGTLPYMSPERLEGGRVDVAGDVYALGVIAYELIAQRLPHPRLSTSTLFEALDIVRRETPPSLAVLEPRARGDLDCVVMKALAADPQRRYSSVAEFAADLERVLDHRPVEARPPSLGYLAARFVRRHRALSIAAAVVAVTLLSASAVSIRFALAEAQARRVAESAAAEAASINAFLERMLTAADPSLAQGREVSVADVLDQAEAELAQNALPPSVRRAVLATLTDTRAALGDFERALALSDQAIAAIHQAERSMQVRLWRRRASVLTELGRFDEARSAIAKARAVLDATGIVAERLGLELSAARLEQEAGASEAAETSYRVILAELERTPMTSQLEEIAEFTRSNLGGLLRDRGALDEALQLTQQVFAERLRKYGERDPRTLASRHKLALAHGAQGDQVAAEREARATLVRQREVLGSAHASTLTTIQTLAYALLAQGQLDEAETLTREALAGFEAQLGRDHAQTLVSLNALAYLLEERGRAEEAEPLYRQIIERTQHDGRDHPETLGARNNLAMLLLNAGRLVDARREFELLLAAATTLVGEAHPYHAIFSSNYGLCLSRQGALAQAASVLESAYERLNQMLGGKHARTRAAAERLAEVYQRQGRADEARRLRAEATP